MAGLRRRTHSTSQRNEQVQDSGNEVGGGELWTERDILVQVPIGRKSRGGDPGRLKVLRRSTAEAVVGLWVHLVLLVYCTIINVYDSTFFKKCEEKDKYFPGHNSFGGRFKFLTYLVMWCLLAYFFLAFFTDIMPQSPAKGWFRKVTDWFFTTVVWSSAWVVVIMYWLLCLIDPKFLDNFTITYTNSCVPVYMNHALHTFPIPIVIIEVLLVFHRYPSNLAAAFSVFSMCSGYFIWVLTVFSKLKEWPYPFMAHLNPITFIFFIASCTGFCVLLYFLGKVVSSLRWRERLLVLQSLDEEDCDS